MVLIEFWDSPYELILVIDGQEKKFTIQEELTRVGETPLFREI